jgi:FAD binding domain-containing protein
MRIPRAVVHPQPVRGSRPRLEELSAAAGLDAAALRETVGDHNRAIATGLDVDLAFGRTLGLAPLATLPFCALQLHPLARKSLGGVRTDLECRVLTAGERAIPGLYASGEVADGRRPDQRRGAPDCDVAASASTYAASESIDCCAP